VVGAGSGHLAPTAWKARAVPRGNVGAMQVMILAAGRGTRLGPLGVELPKPLVPVCGHPAITYGLELVRRAAFRDVVVNLHHHGDLIRAVLGDGSSRGLRISYSEEQELLGTGGGLARARARFSSEPILIMNGKVIADLDLREILDAHRRAPPGTVATMVLRRDPEPEQWAPALIDESGRVVSLRGVRGPTTTIGELRPLMFTGVHVVEASLLDRLPREGVSDAIADAYIPALLDGARIQSVVVDGYFAEHSTPGRYLAGNVALLRRPELLRARPGALVGVDPGAVVAPSARLIEPVRIAAGAVIESGAVVGPDVVVSSGGLVAAGTTVERSVIWPGGVATGDVRGVVVTASGSVAGA
jgi:NDP-sugar pyrophosphorylase family protein